MDHKGLLIYYVLGSLGCDCEQSDPETLKRQQLVSCHHRECAVKFSIALAWEEHNSYSVTSMLYEHLVVIPSYSAEASLFLSSMLVILLPFFLIGQNLMVPCVTRTWHVRSQVVHGLAIYTRTHFPLWPP